MPMMVDERPFSRRSAEARLERLLTERAKLLRLFPDLAHTRTPSPPARVDAAMKSAARAPKPTI